VGTTVIITTKYPIALDSVDHLEPRGALDQQGHEGIEFFTRLKGAYPSIKTVLDLGTGSGWFVSNGVKCGFDVYGIEGTDKVNGKPPWVSYIDQRLFHADLRQRFVLERPYYFGNQLYHEKLKGTPVVTENDITLGILKVDLVTAWDVMEHMTAESIDIVMENIYRHLKHGGCFMGTIEFTDKDNEGYHTLCRSREWWVCKFEEYGFKDLGFAPILQLARHSPEENCFMLQKEK
jgi:SAM-dependent methyltransferase